MLTQNMLKSILRYDKETGIFTRISSGENAGYAVINPEGKEYICIGIKGKQYRAHRLAVLYVTGKWPEYNVSHIDKDRTNNAWCNLRQGTHAEIMKSASLKPRASSGILGVYKSRKKWMARICVNGREIIIGTFSDKQKAKDARQAAEHEYGFV